MWSFNISSKVVTSCQCSLSSAIALRQSRINITNELGKGKHKLKTVALLIISNTFMMIAWYGHLKYKQAPLLATIVVSWAIAFFEYVFQVPANRIGSSYFSLTQLKIMQ